MAYVEVRHLFVKTVVILQPGFHFGCLISEFLVIEWIPVLFQIFVKWDIRLRTYLSHR